ncbi:MAG: hypothetical protein AABY22_26455 [Nanoarchaeota archaeon]
MKNKKLRNGLFRISQKTNQSFSHVCKIAIKFSKKGLPVDSVLRKTEAAINE